MNTRSKVLFIIVLFGLVSCASSPPQLPATTIPANLRQPCPALSPPDDGSAGAVLRWAVATVKAYQVCAGRHLETVEAWPK